MSSSLLLPYLVLMATLMRALAVKARIASPTCGRCALPLERRELGEAVCRCAQAGRR